MKITVKPLTPELSADYFDFFENRMFTDDSPHGCYCQMYQISKEEHDALMADKAAYDYLMQNPGQASRECAERQIADGVLRGYLAYVDGKSIGWCNANDRANYPAKPIHDESFHAPAADKEKAVVCFAIAPDYRGKGVATALLHQAITDAKAEGYAAVVSFPIRTGQCEWDHQGPLRLYEKAGFIKVSETAGKMVMRKDLM